MEFTVFPHLPVELRLMIWERVPQPRRLVGQVACPTCAAFPSSPWQHATRQRQHHRDCGIRFVAQPRDRCGNQAVAIFPPLHACRESRAVWLRRYDRVTSRYLTGKLLSTEEDGVVHRYTLRFDVPFVSYEADIFTIFRPLDYLAGALGDEDDYMHGSDVPGRLVDPFMGLDRNRIRHVAIGEDPEVVGLSAGVALNLPSLPCLETLWVLSFGPRLKSEQEGPRWPPAGFRLGHPGLEITPEEAVGLECTDILDVPERAVAEHGLFGANRPYHPRFSPRLHVRPLKCYRDMLKAWLWHAEHSMLGGAEQLLGQDMFMFEDFVLGNPPGAGGVMPGPDPSSTCPLVGVPGCGPSGHTRGDIMTWVPRFEIRHLMLYDKAGLVREGMFADYP